tara:strand:- start:921 stop:2081 length:1161 start_codon:yes stop_codon:yes gene_type:complete
MKKNNSIHEKGQYFTSNKYLQKSVCELIRNNSKIILEPSVGRGDLVDYVLQQNKNIKFDLFEIDEKINILESIKNIEITYGDFLLQNIDKTYDTIIGNPPYIKKTKGNIYLEFIDKCYNLLNNDGELIFIVPSDFIKLTSSGNLINKMMDNGTFTDIIHPNDENLFENANIDVIIFRYCKNKLLPKKININNEIKYLINSNGILTFSDTKINSSITFKDYFDIYVGMVTGKETIFKNNKYGHFKLLNKKNKVDNYILINKFPTENDELNSYMLENKNELFLRKMKKFSEKNWFEWGALRNYKTITNNLAKDCLYVSTLSRDKQICFCDKVQYFGGSLIIMIPKKDVDLKKMEHYINSDNFKKNYMYSGRFKIGHKQLSEALFSSEI